MFVIESKYGNDGYATWFKILETLAKTDNHFINCNDETNLMYLAAKCRISVDTLKDIILDLCKLGELDIILWEHSNVIWSDKFIESIMDAYSKRSNSCITKMQLLTDFKRLRIPIPPDNGVYGDVNSVNSPVNTQSKVKYSKEEKNKLLEWIDENAYRVNLLKQPFTDEQYQRLVEDYHKDFIVELLLEMHNWQPLLQKCIVADTTFRSWANRNDRYETWKSKKGLIMPKMNL